MCSPHSPQGVRVEGGFDGLGLRGNDSASVIIDRAVVSAGDLITRLGEGAATMHFVVLPWFSIGTAAMANGLSRAAKAATAAHLQRTEFAHNQTSLRDLPTLTSQSARKRRMQGLWMPQSAQQDRFVRLNRAAQVRPTLMRAS
jgi:alkylation response protein AidB-like acyl-CoA dehydrogenase